MSKGSSQYLCRRKQRPHPLDPMADRFPQTLCQMYLRSSQSTSHWEVPKACYSPSLTVQSGPGQPTFKGGVNASRAHGCHVIHVYHAFKFKVPCLRACDYPSMAPVVGQGLPVPKVPKKIDQWSIKTTINQ